MAIKESDFYSSTCSTVTIFVVACIERTYDAQRKTRRVFNDD